MIVRLAAAAVLSIAAAFLALGPHGLPHFVQRWNLYTAVTAKAPYDFYLGPFPDERSCQVDGRIIKRNGGFADCRATMVLSFSAEQDGQLFWEFLSPGNPFTRICNHALAAVSLRRSEP